MTSNKHTQQGSPTRESKNMRENLFAKIDANDVRMHSRTFFMVKIAGIIVLALAVLAITVLIGNLLFFTLRLNGQDSLLSNGAHGFALFLQVFPWPLLILDAVLIFFLERLLRQFKFGYRSPMLYIVLVLIMVAALGGVLIDRSTPLNDDLLHQADQGHLPPPFGALYQGSRHAPPAGSGLYRGVITALTATSTTLADPDHDSFLVVILPTQGPAANMKLVIGETVVVIGNPIQEKIGVVQAIDIHQIDPNDIPPEDIHDGDDDH
jgi:hypothetical protein